VPLIDGTGFSYLIHSHSVLLSVVKNMQAAKTYIPSPAEILSIR
jgi:hypothetical protein